MRITQPSTTGPIVTPKRGLTRKDQKPDPVATGQAGKQKVSNTANQKKAKPRSYTSQQAGFRPRSGPETGPTEQSTNLIVGKDKEKGRTT